MGNVEIGDLSLKDMGQTDRVKRLREAYFQAIPEICTERAQLITQFHLDNGLFDNERITILEKARAYRYVLENRTPLVWHGHAYAKGGDRFSVADESLLIGSTTGKFKGVPLCPEFMALSLWPELLTIGHRQSNPYWISAEEQEVLNLDVFPHWLDRTILETARKRANGEVMAGSEAATK